MSLDEQETRYEKAILDFDSALALARQAGMENPGNIITSKGLLLLGWAEHEREAGKLQRWQELDTQVEATLREGLATRADNPFAAFGLAKYLLQKVRRMASSADDGRAAVSLSALDNVAQYMAEVLDLLSGEPEAYFRDEWETVRAEAVQLLCKQDMANVIQALQKDRKDLGYALDALRLLEGDIPTEPTIDELEVEQIRAAAGILSAGEQVCGSKVSELGNLLRYATFSADPDRLRLPAYGRRYQLIKRLKDTSSLERPIWLYDYAMLAFQNRDTAEASEAFGRLRRGKRFFEVPRERARVLTKHVDSLEPVPVLVRIVSRDEATGRGWCRLALPFQYRDPIPFSIRTFQSRNASSQIGASPAAHIHIQPAGPYAEPVPR